MIKYYKGLYYTFQTVEKFYIGLSRMPLFQFLTKLESMLATAPASGFCGCRSRGDDADEGLSAV